MSEIVLPSDPDFKTYSDDTTVDSRTVGRVRIPIYASVDRDAPIDWLHTLRAHAPNAVAEVKSTHVLPLLESLPGHVLERMWRGLQKARITVVDPRTYIAVWRDVWKSVTGRDLDLDELRYRANKGNALAAELMTDILGWVTKLVVDDSMPARIDDLVSVAVSYDIFPNGKAPTRTVERSPSEWIGEAKSASGLLRKAIDYSAKSGPAFVDAYDGALSGPMPRGRERQFATPSRLVAEGALRGLSDAHAFDQGDPSMVRRLANRRSTLAERMKDVAPMLWLTPNPGELVEMESRASLRIQAADIAAGIARQLFERDGLLGVVTKFEDVRYNGVRATTKNLEALRRTAF